MGKSLKEYEILEENFKYLSERNRLISEQKRISLAALARFLVDNRLQTADRSENEENVFVPDAYLSHTDISASDCVEFFKVLASNGIRPTGTSEDEEAYEIFSPDSSSKISYVRNNYNDAAFFRFSKLFSTPTVSYGTNFEDICAEVYNFASDYCILPIESSSSGKLLSFYTLIDKYDLNIFAVCDMEEGGGGRRTRYALLSKKKLIYPKSFKSEETYFEFSVTGDTEYHLNDILEAAQYASMSLYRIDALPVSYDDEKFRFYHVFKTNKDTVEPFIMYLNYKYPQHEVIGNYISV